MHLQKRLLQEIFRQVWVASEPVQVTPETRGELVIDDREGGIFPLGITRHGLISPRRWRTLTHEARSTMRDRSLGTIHHESGLHHEAMQRNG